MHNPKCAFVERSVRRCPFQICFWKVQLLVVIVKTYCAQHLVLTALLLEFQVFHVKYQSSNSNLSSAEPLFSASLFSQASCLSFLPLFPLLECIIFSESQFGIQFFHYSVLLPHLEHSCFLNFLNKHFCPKLN